MGRTAAIDAWLFIRSTARRRRSLFLLLLLAVTMTVAGCSWFRQVRMMTLLVPPFLGPSDFQGSYAPRQAEAQHGLQSTYSGTLAVTAVRRDIVQQMLPPGLSLAQPKPVWGSSRHPVMHLIGDQEQPSHLVAGQAFPVSPVGYREMILVVPFVVRGNGTLWHNYVVRMYLTDLIAVFGGNELYGYAKEKAKIDLARAGAVDRYTVASEDGSTTWFRNDIEVPASTANTAATPPPRWADIRGMLEMPVLGQLSDGTLVCSYWEFDYASAQVAPTSSSHQVVTRFRPGMQEWETMGVLHSAPDGAVTLRQVRWRLAWPWLVQGC